MEIPFVGGAYLGRSTNLDAQVCQNLYPVVDQQGGKSVLALFGVPGLTSYLYLVTGGGGVISIYEDTESSPMHIGGNLVSLPTPSTFLGSYQNVDYGTDGLISCSMIGATPTVLNAFYQNPSSENRSELDIALFPLTISGHIFTSFTAGKTPCIVRRSSYSVAAFSAYSSADSINGNCIEILRNGAITRKTLTYTNDDEVHNSPFWLEAYDDGTIVTALRDNSSLDRNIKVMRSTDYGAKWTTITVLQLSAYVFEHPVLFKGSNDNLYIVAAESYGGYYKRVHFFMSTDKGATWVEKTLIFSATGGGAFGIFCGCANDTTIYVGYGGVYSSTTAQTKIYYSTDWGLSWSSIAKTTWRSLSCLAVDGTNLIGCTKLTNDLFTPSTFRVQKSTDGGVTFSETLTPPSDLTGPYPYNHSLRNNGAIFTYTYDGLKNGVNLAYYLSPDDGVTWSSKNMGRIAA